MKNLSVFLLLALFINAAKATNFRVLFLGNSYTYYNDLPGLLDSIATNEGDTCVVDSYAPGGYTFNSLSADANAIAKLALGNWDFIIIQGQSQEPSFSPGQVAQNTLPYARLLDSVAKAYNPCGSVLYYMTWGRKYGDASNCAAYPPICTYNGMQQRLKESYLLMAQNNSSSVAPVGVVWQQVRNVDSTIELYNPDLSHPSLAGSYVAATAFYNSIFHKALNANSYTPNGLNSSHANIIRTYSNKIVLDSLENWQKYGNIPNAKMSTTNTNLDYTFFNNSERFTISTWQFGDGSAATNTNLINLKNYANAGTYTVSLTAGSNCKYYKTSQTIIATNTTSIINNAVVKPFEINNNTMQFLNNGKKKILVFNTTGALVLNTTIERSTLYLNLPQGIYTYQIVTNNKVAKGRFAL